MSQPFPVKHGDIVTVGGTTLCLHIHGGTETCDDCEPGLVQAKVKAKQEKEEFENRGRDRNDSLNLLFVL